MAAPRQVVGRYGTAVLDPDAPAGLDARVLEVLGGPSPSDTEDLDPERTGVWIDPDDIAPALESQVVDTGVWTDTGDASAPSGQEPGGWAQYDTSAPPPFASRFPEPEPGSGRRRRRPVPAVEPVPQDARVQALSMPTEAITSGASGASAPTGAMTGGRPSGPTRPLVTSVMCAAGHANPPDAPRCHMCVAPLTGELRRVPRPVLAILMLSTGESVGVQGDLVVGRAPQPQAGGEPGMALLAVPSPTHLVSRSHLFVTTAGWNVLARDLGSNNGTVLVRPGQPPVLLATALPTPLYVGDLLDVGDGVTLRVEPPG
ncbi:MAG: hypothetical protein Q4C85_09390 [Actinomyces sp.]|uniref:hypothetical protein n=1 Tax=Actinomyces sp. TaxID=29317 RepID=UPI0026DCB8FB|nr:hypothetical protein [Actinomyces sp.]MDO4243951.1 hypothetical protein [Actinomyces sp.]